MDHAYEDPSYYNARRVHADIAEKLRKQGAGDVNGYTRAQRAELRRAASKAKDDARGGDSA